MTYAQNINITVTDVEFNLSVWHAKSTSLMFANCHTGLLTIFLDKGKNFSEVYLQISDSLIGSHISVSEAIVSLQNCTVSQNNTYIGTYNSTIIANSISVGNVQGENLFFLNATLAQFKNATFTNCASAAPLIDTTNQSTVSLIRSTFSSNSAPLVSSEERSILNISNCTFQNNEISNFSPSRYRGLVRAVDVSFLIIDNTLFLKNAIADVGAVCFIVNSVATIQNSTFEGNSKRSAVGAALYVAHGAIKIKGSRFVWNEGGTMSIHNSLDVDISTSSFVGNTAKYGGAIFMDSYSAHLDSHHQPFVHRRKTHYPDKKELDAIRTFVDRYFMPLLIIPEQLIHNCTFVNNTADRGGAIRADNISLIMKGNLFLNNSAKNNISSAGGAVFAHNSPINIEECVFDGNSAIYGGALFASNRSVSIQSCVFSKNLAVKINMASGGAIGVQNKEGTTHVTLSVSKCMFDENEALGMGGAILADIVVSTKIEESTFKRNRAREAGGMSFHSGNITNCLFEANYARDSGGAVYFFNQTVISHTNFTHNTASGGGAVMGTNDLLCTFCLFHNNTCGVG